MFVNIMERVKMLKNSKFLNNMERVQMIKTWKFVYKCVQKKQKVDRVKDKLEYKKEMKQLGKWTACELINLGPTYIKLGQTLSTRQDVFPKEFTNELEILQDSVTEIDFDIIRERIDEEIGMDKFLAVSSEPFKAASLGQVHKAKLINGKSVIIKIRRPNIENVIKYDTENITNILEILSLVGIVQGPSLKTILNDAKKFIIEEIDYNNEMSNCITMCKLFSNTNWVKIPKMYTKLCTNNVIVMEYVESIKITDVEKLQQNKTNFKRLCQGLLTSFILQVKDYGYFHGDPHPGNIGVTMDGKIVYFDFGLTIQIPESISEKTEDLLLCIVQNDIQQLVTILVELKLIIPTTDESEIVLFLEALLLYFQKFDKSELNSTMVQNDLNDTFTNEKPFILPPEFLFLGRSIVLIDGICRKLDPSFNFFNSATNLLQDDLMETINLRKITMTAFEMPNRVKSISNSINAIEKSKRSLKKNINLTQSNVKTAQISTISSIIAANTDNEIIFLFSVFVTCFFIWKIQFSKNESF